MSGDSKRLIQRHHSEWQGDEREERPASCVSEESPASLPCPSAERRGEEPSSATVSVSVLSTLYIGLRRRRLWLPVELCRHRPWVGWEVRQGEVVNGKHNLYLMMLGVGGC